MINRAPKAFDGTAEWSIEHHVQNDDREGKDTTASIESWHLSGKFDGPAHRYALLGQNEEGSLTTGGSITTARIMKI